MGILRKGIFGGFQQKAGPLTGRISKGKSIITGNHHPSTTPRTELQQQENGKFGFMSSFLSPLNPLIAVGFKYLGKNKNSFSEAMSYNFGHAILDHGNEGYRIDYKKLLYSKGNLESPFNPLVSYSAASVHYTWALTSHCNYDDLASFMVYNEDQQIPVAAIDIVKRSARTYSLALPAPFAHGKIHCYMSMRNTKGRKVSNSIYVGLLTL